MIQPLPAPPRWSLVGPGRLFAFYVFSLSGSCRIRQDSEGGVLLYGSSQSRAQVNTGVFIMDTSVFWASNMFMRPDVFATKTNQHLKITCGNTQIMLTLHNCNIWTHIRLYLHMWPLAWQPQILTDRREPCEPRSKLAEKDH